MKVLIIYNSIHQGNTEKIAKAMAEEIKADLIKPNQINFDAIKDYDVFGFGSGIYFWKHHITLLNFIEKLPHSNKKAFIFSTNGFNVPWLYNREIKKKLSAKGFNLIGEFSCRGLDKWGPAKFVGGINKGRPNEKDIKKAKDFARKLLYKL